MWNNLTFPALDEDRQGHPLEIARAGELAEGAKDLFVAFGKWVIELGKPIWEMLKKVSASASWTKKQGRGTESDQDSVGQTSTAATEIAAAAVRDSEEDLDEAGDPDDVDTAPVLE